MSTAHDLAALSADELHARMRHHAALRDHSAARGESGLAAWHNERAARLADERDRRQLAGPDDDTTRGAIVGTPEAQETQAPVKRGRMRAIQRNTDRN